MTLAQIGVAVLTSVVASLRAALRRRKKILVVRDRYYAIRRDA